MLIALMVDAFVSKMQAREASRRDPENYRIKNNSCYPERQCECPKKCFCCPHNTNCCPKGANILAVLGYQIHICFSKCTFSILAFIFNNVFMTEKVSVEKTVTVTLVKEDLELLVCEMEFIEKGDKNNQSINKAIRNWRNRFFNTTVSTL